MSKLFLSNPPVSFLLKSFLVDQHSDDIFGSQGNLASAPPRPPNFISWNQWFMCRVLSPFPLSLSTHLVDHLPKPETECTFENIHQPSQQSNFLPKAISYPTSSDLFSSPLPALSKRYAIFAVPINLRCSLSSSSEVGTCRKGIRFFFFCRALSWFIPQTPCYLLLRVWPEVFAVEVFRILPKSRLLSLVHTARIWCPMNTSRVLDVSGCPLRQTLPSALSLQLHSTVLSSALSSWWSSLLTA